MAVWSIIGSAIIWGLTIIVSAVMLRGTDAKNVIFFIAAAAIIHFLAISIPVARQFRMKKDSD
jgi:uncharacterized membrane protein